MAFLLNNKEQIYPILVWKTYKTQAQIATCSIFKLHIYRLCLHPAPAFSPSPRSVLLSGRRAHGDWQGALWQVRAGAVAANAVHFGKEVAAHLLAGTTPRIAIMISCIDSLSDVTVDLPFFFLPSISCFSGVCVQQCQVQRSRSTVWLPQGQHGSELRQPVCHALQLPRTAATSGWDWSIWDA